MELIRLYFTAVIGTVIAGMLVCHFVKGARTREHVGIWALIIMGFCLVSIAFLNVEPDTIGIVLGSSSIIGGLAGLMTERSGRVMP